MSTIQQQIYFLMVITGQRELHKDITALFVEEKILIQVPFKRRLVARREYFYAVFKKMD